MADITSAISLEELNKRFAQIGYDEEGFEKNQAACKNSLMLRLQKVKLNL